MAAETELYLPILDAPVLQVCTARAGQEECDCEKCETKRKRRAEKLRRLLELDELTNNLPAIPTVEDTPAFETI